MLLHCFNSQLAQIIRHNQRTFSFSNYFRVQRFSLFVMHFVWCALLPHSFRTVVHWTSPFALRACPRVCRVSVPAAGRDFYFSYCSLALAGHQRTANDEILPLSLIHWRTHKHTRRYTNTPKSVKPNREEKEHERKRKLFGAAKLSHSFLFDFTSVLLSFSIPTLPPYAPIRSTFLLAVFSRVFCLDEQRFCAGNCRYVSFC